MGRITTIAAVAASPRSSTWLAGLPLVGYVLVHVGLVWLVRSLYYYSGVLPALADLGLSVLGAAFAVWAAQRSGTAWLALWCFFLAQAFFVLIPASLSGRARERQRRAIRRSTARIEPRKRPCAASRRRAERNRSTPSSTTELNVMKANILVTGLVLATVGDGVDLSHRCAATRRPSRCTPHDHSRSADRHEQGRGRVRARHDRQHGRPDRRGEGEDLVDREHAGAGATGARDLDGPRRVSRPRRRVRHASRRSVQGPRLDVREARCTFGPTAAATAPRT